MGGFATVWLYRDEELRSDVAVKALAENWAQRLDIRERFLEEARILRRADSDHVVRVYDIGEEDGTPYFVMTYADQGSLAQVVDTGRPVDPARVVDLVCQAAEGIGVLHGQGVVHRDIKPPNLLLRSHGDDDNRLLVADLGVAKAMLHASGLTQVVGTPAYMAPEQANGLGVDSRADIHALAAVAYQLLTGVPVREGGFAAFADPRLPPPPSTRADVPPALDDVILRALEPDPDDRYSEVAEFASALRHALPVDAPAPGSFPATAAGPPATAARPSGPTDSRWPCCSSWCWRRPSRRRTPWCAGCCDRAGGALPWTRRPPHPRRASRPSSPTRVTDRTERRTMSTRQSPAAPDVFELDHEQVVYCNDPGTGLKAIVAIHSTALGPALGGTRFYPYASTAAALSDVLNLSRGMSYKAALAGLDLGGGKAVIIGDPTTAKTEPLLRAYGRFVQSLGGRYYTACDVGTYSHDMDVVARECGFVTGRTTAHGGAGDSSVLTAYGVFQGMRAAAEVVWGSPSLAGRTVGVSGVGKVGHHLVRLLVEDGATIVINDVSPSAVARVVGEHPDVRVAGSTDQLVASALDVYAPCALGGALTDDVVEVLSARIVCGAANNQLAHPGVEKALEERGILYAPDYCVNSGGLIQVADELEGFSFERAKARAGGIFETTREVFALAASDGVPAAIAADRLAERRMRDVGRLRGVWLPND